MCVPLAIALPAVGAAVSAAGSVAGGVMAQQQANYQAKAAQINAGAANQQGYAHAGAVRSQYDEVAAQQRAQLAAAGVDVSSAGAGTLGLETQKRAEQAAATQIWQGRSEATATTLPDGRIAVLGGTPASRDAIVVDGTTGAVSTAADALSTPRRQPAVSTTARHVVVAGGSDATGAAIGSADVLDATTLAHLATLPILPRTGGFAIALPNEQVLLGGGAPASAALELFTPEPPASP